MDGYQRETTKTKYNSVITFKINKDRYDFPTCWPDVTYSQYIALIHTSTITDYISVFTGIPRETLETAELKNLEKISLALSFLSFAPSFDRTSMVGPYVLPLDVTIQSTGQFEDLRGLLLKLPKDVKTEPEQFAELCLHACAVYCQKIKDGKYDWNKTFEVKEELKNYSCAEVIGTGAFFLFRPLNLSKNTTNPYRRFSQRLKNIILGLPGYRKTSDSLRRYFGLAAK